jgi:hypothetical protein
MTSFFLKDKRELTIFALRVRLKSGADFIKWLHNAHETFSAFPCQVSGFVNFSDQRKEYLCFDGEFKMSEFWWSTELHLGDRIIDIDADELAELCIRSSRRPKSCSVASVITVPT